MTEIISQFADTQPNKAIKLCSGNEYHNDSLPLPEDVFASNAVEYSLFRQDSWQWGALHEGRLTTARAAACLGFYEQESARILKVPRSLSGHSKVLHLLHRRDCPPFSISIN
jgi:hypothetical protein